MLFLRRCLAVEGFNKFTSNKHSFSCCVDNLKKNSFRCFSQNIAVFMDICLFKTFVIMEATEN